MKLRRRIIWGVGLLVLVALLGMAGLVFYLDRNKALVESAASQALGRDVRIDDGISLRWSMKPSISLQGLRVGNPAWAGGEDFARAQLAYLQLDIASLLQGHLGIAEVVLQNADVLLATAADGRRNWDFGGEASASAGPRIDRLVLENSRLRYRQAGAEERQLAVKHLALLGLGGAQASVTAEFNFHDVPIAISAEARADTAGSQAARTFKGRLSSAEMTVDFSGRAAAQSDALEVALTVRGDRVDLPPALLAALPGSAGVGPLQRVSGQFKTTGSSMESLIRNLSGKLDIGSLRVTLPAKKGGDATNIGFTETTISLLPGKPVSLHSRVQFREQSFQLELHGGRLAGLLSHDKRWKSVGLKLRGQIEHKPFSLSTRLQGSEHHLTLKDIAATIAGSEITGELHLPLAEGERIEARLKAKTIDLKPFLAGTEADSGDVDDVGVLLSWELFPGALAQWDAIVRLEIAHLSSDQVQYDGLRLKATLDHGHLQLVVEDEAEKLDTLIDLEPAGSAWRLTLQNKGELDLGLLMDAKGADGAAPKQTASVDVNLVGSGKSLASAIASATGHVNLVVGAGQLSNEIARHLPLGSVLLTLLNAISKEQQVRTASQLECAVLHLDVADGIGTSTNGLALRTDSVNVVGAGTVNLTSGEIDLRFKTAQRKGLGISIIGLADNFIRLTGTLAQPKVDVNVGGVVTHGGAAVATGGLSLVFEALFTRLTAFSNPCETVLQEGKQ